MKSLAPTMSASTVFCANVVPPLRRTPSSRFFSWEARTQFDTSDAHEEYGVKPPILRGKGTPSSSKKRLWSGYCSRIKALGRVRWWAELLELTLAAHRTRQAPPSLI